MKYAILLKDRRKVDAPQIEEYCAASGFAIDEIVVFEEFATFCQRLNAGDSVITASVVTLGKRFEDIINNVELLAAHGANLYCVKEQILIDTELPQTADKLLNICLKLYKGVMSFRNKSIQDNLLKAGRPRGAPAHKQEYLDSQKEKIKDLLKRGISVLQISELLDCSYRTLYRYLKNHPEVRNG